jgi:lipopolysaccharide/colanic/teichoic acid biosynthesis glycosyltransferase
LFDCLCVLAALPLLAPLLLLVGVAVRLTSRGPALFLQERVGRNGRIFTIYKFRTMTHAAGTVHHPITTSTREGFTPIGPLLRQWKLDELPQLANVLLGHMSLVGPRPKLPEHMISHLPCRPGITGMATIVFANEETALARIPAVRLDAYYQDVVLPAKCRLDIDYMSRATFISDIGLLANSVLHRWDDVAMERILFSAEPESENREGPSHEFHPPWMAPNASTEQIELSD